jgi:hypothetical protein
MEAMMNATASSYFRQMAAREYYDSQTEAELRNSISDKMDEEKYYKDLWNEIQEEWKANLGQEWICKELGEDLIIFDYVPQCQEQFYGCSLATFDYRLCLVDQETLDHYRSLEAAGWRVKLNQYGWTAYKTGTLM